MSQLILMTAAATVTTICDDLTRLGYADYLVQTTPLNLSETLVILRVPDALAPGVRATLGWSNPANPEPFNLNIDRRWVPWRPSLLNVKR